MQPITTYLGARLVAPGVEERFKQQLQNALRGEEQHLAPAPSAAEIEAILDVAFWASLRREEGHSPKISLAFLPPSAADQPLLFSHPLPLTSTVLTKLSPGVERPGIHLGVWREDDKLCVWGTTRKIPSLCFVLDVSEPGLLVIKHRRMDGFGKFANVAILTGDQVNFVDEQITAVPDCPSLITSLLGSQTSSFWSDSLNVLVQLAVSMRAHGRGGILLIVPGDTDKWRESIIHPLHYSMTPPFKGLGELMEQHPHDKKQSQWQAELKREVDTVAGLTAVDGATIISDQYHLLAFGTKIGRAIDKPPITRIYMTEPIVGSAALIVHPGQSGGTRHLSAAQFVQDQHDSLALVASQDGRFTIFSWSPCEQIVQAHRIDSLLL